MAAYWLVYCLFEAFSPEQLDPAPEAPQAVSLYSITTSEHFPRFGELNRVRWRFA